MMNDEGMTITLVCRIIPLSTLFLEMNLKLTVSVREENEYRRCTELEDCYIDPYLTLSCLMFPYSGPHVALLLLLGFETAFLHSWHSPALLTARLWLRDWLQDCDCNSNRICRWYLYIRFHNTYAFLFCPYGFQPTQLFSAEWTAWW